jgi:hypothetical protein
MGSDWGEFWRRILRFSWFGHQSLFEIIPTCVVPCTTGHLPALLSSVLGSIFPSDRVQVFSELFRVEILAFWELLPTRSQLPSSVQNFAARLRTLRFALAVPCFPQGAPSFRGMLLAVMHEGA